MDKRVQAVLAVVVIGVLAMPATAASRWETDFQKASETAKASNRYILLDFSGSDWCGWCMKLGEEVFSRRAFKDYAQENLVCVLIDFPQRTALKKSLKEQNEQLKNKYGVRGFPTVLILSPDGDLVTQTGYQEGGAEKYVKHLQGSIDPHRTKNNVPPPTSALGDKPRQATHPSARRATPANLPRSEDREIRTWTSRNGATVTASLVEEKGSYEVLKREDGTTVQVLKSSLSDEDQKYIAQLKEEASAPPTEFGGKP